MIKLLYVIVIVITVFIGLTFTYMNSQMVELKYLSFRTEINLALLLIGTLILGILAGFFASLLSSLKVRRHLSKVKKELKHLQSSSL
ncbi:lipopolysaccharide assembly protein LapA domain-containing protein [Candidatus Spongiihabitans sp.]|uniref:lipopolysaccharide assembly protein LapA domain-containing protein n=1 Tax=Candidatus Spongiihabitans sp. TaxID=3101308 RepID=UPI003C7C53A7